MRLSECGTYWIPEISSVTAYSLLPCIDCKKIEGDDGFNKCKAYDLCIANLDIGKPLKQFQPTKEYRLRRGIDARLKKDD